jgi:hypothetical protein
VLGREMMKHLNKDSNSYLTSALLITAVITTAVLLPFLIITSNIAIPAAATTTTTAGSNATTTITQPSSGVELSTEPVWEEQATTTGMTPINQTHSIATFIGNGTLTVPETGETINMTNNGTAFISPVAGVAGTVSAYGKENVFSSDDGYKTAITFHEIIRYDPTTFEGKGTVIAVFDANATGSLAPFNDMFVVGTHEENPNSRAATITLWRWESELPLPLPTNTTTATTMQEGAQ